MSVLAPTLVAALGATLPAAALAWLAGSLAERLALSAAARAMVWRLGLAVTVATLLATPFGLLRKAARVAPARQVSTIAEGPARAASAAATAPSPHFDPAVLIPPLALLLIAGMAVGLGGLLLRAW